MRKLTGHIVNPTNDKLEVAVRDEPGSGGANHLYIIRGGDWEANPSYKAHRLDIDGDDYIVMFQNGPIVENGVNGLTHEVLLAILIDRLDAFQAGPFASTYNEFALHHLTQAQEALQSRTRERMARGVEGTHKV